MSLAIVRRVVAVANPVACGFIARGTEFVPLDPPPQLWRLAKIDAPGARYVAGLALVAQAVANHPYDALLELAIAQPG